MSRHQQATPTMTPRAFIDRIVSINREHGMGVTQEAIEPAIEGVTVLASGARPDEEDDTEDA